MLNSLPHQTPNTGTKNSSTSGDASEIGGQLYLYSVVNKQYKKYCLLMHDKGIDFTN